MTGLVRFPGEHFKRVNGALCLGGLKLGDLAKTYGTPLFVYDFGRIRERARQLMVELASVNPESRAYFAVKSLSNLSVLRLIGDQGLGMDVVSGGEIERCLAAGVPASDIIFSGVAKTELEISLGIQAQIGCFNIESPHEVDLLTRRLAGTNKTANVALRINPDVDGKTHAKINTGLAETKFGLSPALAASLVTKINKSPSLRLVGVSCHIGSQIFDLQTYKDAATEVREFASNLLRMGVKLKHIDMGGGLGVAYRPEDLSKVASFKDWVSVARLALPDPSMALFLEPGRSIVADSGVLLTSVIDVKEGEKKHFALVDAGMTELIRPALYDAYHHIEDVSFETTDATNVYDVVGPVCETSCWLGDKVQLPRQAPGHVLAILSAGAYGMSMASNYNTRTRPAEVALDQGQSRVIRKQEALSSLWDTERF